MSEDEEYQFTDWEKEYIDGYVRASSKWAHAIYEHMKKLSEKQEKERRESW